MALPPDLDALSRLMQVPTALFALHEPMDGRRAYRKAMKRLVRGRYGALYRALGIARADDPDGACYYTLLDRVLAEYAEEYRAAPATAEAGRRWPRYGGICRRAAMPELPEVEIFARVVRDHCRGRTIERVAVADPFILEGVAPAALERRLTGAPIRAAERYGKHLFVLLGRAGTLAMHFGTNGSLEPVSPAAAAPRYTRLQLHFADGGGLAYVNPRRLGRVSLCDGAAAFAAANRLGPDALDPALDLPRFAALLAKSRRDVKALLMDQKRLAGIGNIYSDEILFQARIHPGAVASALNEEDAGHLFHAMRETLATAIRCGAGSEQMTERLPKDFLLPQRHSGGRCPRCGTPLGVLKHAGRTGYYCPRCQRA